MRINLFGCPGSGKSKLALFLGDELDRRGWQIELVQEAIKDKAYRNEVPGKWESLDIFHQQLKDERRWIDAGVANLVTDCPLALTTFYMSRYGNPLVFACHQVVEEFDRENPSVNILLKRPSFWPYPQSGRYQSHQQAMEVHESLLVYLDNSKIPYKLLPAEDRERIVQYIELSLLDQPREGTGS